MKRVMTLNPLMHNSFLKDYIYMGLSKQKNKTQRRKKGGSSPLAKRRKTQKVWSELPKEHQILCKKYNPKYLDKLADKCRKFEDTDIWVHNSYGIEKVSDEASPLYLFKEKEDNQFSDIQNGVHNFMLFWDESTEEYTLVTAYFNAFEFGSKHNIISYRTRGLTADTFIISGEIKKDGNAIRFHDTSSQFFQDNICNIKRQMPIIYLSELIDELDVEDLDVLKRKLFETNVYDEKFRKRINQANTLDELVQSVSTYLPIPNIDQSIIQKNYVELIQHILVDAFAHLFKKNIPITYVKEFAPHDYGDQINVKEFTQQMCRLDKPIPFDVYFTENDCIQSRKKSQYNTCQLDSITSEYKSDMKKKTPEADVREKILSQPTLKSVYINGQLMTDGEIKKYWPNWITVKNTPIYIEQPELLYPLLTGRIQKKEPGALIEFK